MSLWNEKEEEEEEEEEEGTQQEEKRKGERIDIDIYIVRRISIINPDLLLDSSFSFLPSLSPLSFFLSLSLSLCVPLHTLTFFFCVLSCFFCLLSCIDRMYRCTFSYEGIPM